MLPRSSDSCMDRDSMLDLGINFCSHNNYIHDIESIRHSNCTKAFKNGFQQNYIRLRATVCSLIIHELS